MCWSYPITPQSLFAEQDIVVYKCGFKQNPRTFKSLYQQYIYLKGKKQPIIPLEVIHQNNRYEIHKGYHSYITKDCLPTRYTQKDVEIAEFIIPKGSTYYIDLIGHIVSNTIRFKQWKNNKNYNTHIT